MSLLIRLLTAFWEKLYGGNIADLRAKSSLITESADTIYDFYRTVGACYSITHKQYVFIHTIVLEEELLDQGDERLFEIHLASKHLPELPNPDWSSWKKALENEVSKRHRLMKLRAKVVDSQDPFE